MLHRWRGSKRSALDLRLQRGLHRLVEGIGGLCRLPFLLLLGDEGVALLDQRGHALVDLAALGHVLGDRGLPLFRLQRADRIRKFVVLDGCELLTAGRDIGDQIAVAGNGFGRAASAWRARLFR